MEYTIEQRKSQIINSLESIHDYTLLDLIADFIESHKSVSLTQREIEGIEKGFEDVMNGRVIPHSEVKKIYEKWL
jgi:predicted transcriptional regulator